MSHVVYQPSWKTAYERLADEVAGEVDDEIDDHGRKEGSYSVHLEVIRRKE